MKIKSLTIFMACLLLSCFAVPVLTACCTPPQPPCSRCENGVWVWRCGDGQNCCGGRCCSNECCPDDRTCCSSANETCCGSSTCFNFYTKRCCDGKTIYDPNTKYCCRDGDGTVCDINKVCCDGQCYDPSTQQCCYDTENGYICDINKACCDGSCCDKVWTTQTVGPIDQPCGSCNYSIGGCSGISKILTSYEKCLNVGVGQGEHCQCNETVHPQVVGYVYLCGENWDVSKILWCVAQGAWCAIIDCNPAYFDPASCANCLMSEQADCCPDGPCETCDFIESCDPYNPLEMTERVFTDFGC